MYCQKMISFFITTKCNLCCRYCYNVKERNKVQEQTIPIDLAKASIDWYFHNNTSRYIRFYGPGEPTQEYERIKQITEYAKAYKNGGDRVKVEIQSNGVFDEKVREWILNNVNVLWLSFDGTPDIQNYNRPLNPKYNNKYGNKKSAEIIEDNVKWLISNTNGRDLMVGARVTITNNNINRQIEMINYFEKLGIKYIWNAPIFKEVRKKPVCENKDLINKDDNLDMNLYVDNYVEAYNYAKNKGMFYGSFLTINFDGNSSYHCRCCTPLKSPNITPDGYITACDMVLLGKEAYHMEPLIVGKWNCEKQEFELFEDKINALKKRKSTEMEHCKNCPAKMHCGGYCLGEVVNETGKIDGQNIDRCIAIITLFNKLGKLDKFKYVID